MASREPQRRSGAGPVSRDAAAAPVRARTTTEQRSVSTAMWCRGISLVILILGFVVGVLYASAKMRFVEDVLPKISGTRLRGPANVSRALPRRSRAPAAPRASTRPAFSFPLRSIMLSLATTRRLLSRRLTAHPKPARALLNESPDPFTFWAFNVVVASFAVVPGAASATSIAAGVIYGTPLGVALVGSSCAVGAGVSFIIARYAARPIVEKIFLRGDGDASKFAALDQAVMRDGAQIVLLTRLSPLSPYVAMSFAFGLTAVDFAPYIAASAVGILPASALYVYLGDTGRRAAGSGASGTSKLEIAFYVFGLIMTALVTVRITRLANDALGAKTGAGRSNQSTPREGRGRRDAAAAAAAAKPSALNLFGLLGFGNRVSKPGGRSGTRGDAFGGDGDDSDFDSYYDTDEEDERAGMLEMAERGDGRARRGDDDAPETQLEVSEPAGTGDSSRRNSGVFLVADPLAGPAPLGSPTPKK